MKVCTSCGQEWPDDQKFCPNDGTALRSAGKTADLVGSVVAERYHITKKLGEGGMGAVYLGEHVKMGRKSAIKVMSQSMANDPDSIARFNREAANAARINHPNVCAIYDFGETPDGVIYLAMEFIEGEALTDLIEREGALNAQRATKILRQTADALQTAHDMGIVHRDLKPDNIMIAQGRDGDIVKVVDFGIAKAMGPEEGQNVTKTGLVVGTPEYMSPEQLSGDKLDGRSDLYSLGLVYFRMLTGDLPFQADSAQEVMIKRLTDDPSPLNEVVPGANFPEALQGVLNRALARMPGERYGSAVEFAKDAEGAISGMPVSAPAAGADTEGATQLIDTAQTAAIAKTRVGGKAKTKTPDTAQPLPSPPAPEKKKPPIALAAGVVVALAAAGVGGWAMFGGGDTPLDSIPTVTGNTDSAPPANNPQQANNPQGNDRPASPPTTNPTTNPGQTTTPTSTTTTPPETAAPIDSAALMRRIFALTDPLLEDTQLSEAAKTELRNIWDNQRVPASVRGAAAFNLVQAYALEGANTSACLWLGRAVQLPLTENQRTGLTGQRSGLGCP